MNPIIPAIFLLTLAAMLIAQRSALAAVWKGLRIKWDQVHPGNKDSIKLILWGLFILIAWALTEFNWR